MRGPRSRDHRRVVRTGADRQHGGMHRTARVVALCALLAAALSPVAAFAIDKVIETGGCIGGPSVYRLVTRQVDAETLRVRVVITGSVAGQEWSMFVSDNGDRLIRNTKTAAADGSVRWARQTNDRAGLDTIEMSAVNRNSGETCADVIPFAEN